MIGAALWAALPLAAAEPAPATEAPPDGAALTLEAAALRWTPEALSATDGRLWLQDGQLGFASLTLDLATYQVTAQRIAFTTCAGARPAWSFTAARARVAEDGPLWLAGGWFRLGGVPVLPLPAAALPTQERSARLLLPEVGRVEDGWFAALPVWLPLGDQAALTLAPEWRQVRGVRGLADLEHPGGHLGGAIGWDTQQEALRGALYRQAQRAYGPLRWAYAGTLLSDGAYQADYGDDLLARSTPWLERRRRVELGPLRLTSLGAQLTDATGPTLDARYALASSWPVLPVGPARLGAKLRADALDGLGAPPRMSAQATAGWVESLGPLELTAAARGGGIVYTDALAGRDYAAMDGALGGRLMAPAWADHGGWRHEIALGVGGGLGGRVGALAPAADGALRWPWDEAPDAWSAGPILESRWWRSGAYAQLEASAPLTPGGPGAVGRARVGAGSWSLQAQGDLAAGLYGGGLGWEDEVFDAWAQTWWRTDDAPVEQIRGGAAVRFRAPGGWWRPSIEALADPGAAPGEAAVQSWAAGLGWINPCGCLSVEGSAGFASDRVGPQLDVSLDLGL